MSKIERTIYNITTDMFFNYIRLFLSKDLEKIKSVKDLREYVKFVTSTNYEELYKGIISKQKYLMTNFKDIEWVYFDDLLECDDFISNDDYLYELDEYILVRDTCDDKKLTYLMHSLYFNLK